ncbi:MAG: class A beta-lactamase-related serine hydrolase, partial [Deltaproteobacteria bacterium]
FTVSPAEKRRETILERLLTLPLESPPGEEIRYSDAGYILLGFLLERGTGKSLKELLRKKITEPLRLMDTGFTPLDEVPHCDSARIVGTGFCHVRRREKVGEPDDLNCYALGGVAGHAGIFSTASDLTALGTYLLRKWREEVEENREGLVTYLLQEVKDRRGRKRFLGFDRPEGENSLAGRGCSPLTAGHLGWTGTSIWIDFGRGRGVVFLTDHVACGGDREEFNQVRRRVHTAAWEVAGG